ESDIVKEGTYHWGQPIKTTVGTLFLTANPKMSKEIYAAYTINFIPLQDKVSQMRTRLNISPDADKKSMAINLNLISPNPQLAKQFIDELIKTYNQDLQEDNRLLSTATTNFINQRLEIIAEDLSGVDKSLENFKSENRLNNAEAEANAFLTEAMQVEKELVTLKAQLQVVQQLNQTLRATTTALLPSNVGIQDAALTASINTYNQLVLERMDVAKSMRDNNPGMEALDKNIAELKQSILASLRIYENSVKTQLSVVENKQQQSNSRLNQLPKQESGFRKIARQQQIVESIYLYLLQKREEAEITASATIEGVKIIDWAFSNKQPVSPKPPIIILGSVILGLLIPTAVIY